MAEQRPADDSEMSTSTSSAPAHDAAYTAVPHDDAASSFREPRAPYLSDTVPATTESPRDSLFQAAPSTPSASGMLLPTKNEEYEGLAQEDLIGGGSNGAGGAAPSKAKRRRLLPILIGLAALVAIILAVILPVYFTVIKPHKKTSTLASSSSTQQTTDGPSSPSGTASSAGALPTTVSAEAITGGDGSTVKASNGSTFTYSNQFGGIWYSDPNDPYNNNAYPNSWTPPLNQSWDYAQDRIYGVNMGGWFVLEPFITPALYQKYPGAVDEWTLSTLMAADTASGGINQLEDHYKTFITEQDFAEIASAGLNWIRLPIPFWAIDTWGNEPFLAKVSWKYIVQAFQWARKYGLRIKLDLHTVPGSQNGYNHSGKGGQINFLMGTMGMANAERVMNYIRIITEFISQPEYRDVVPLFGIMNEPRIHNIGDAELQGFYVEVYNMIRGITGVGAGKGPVIGFHEGFAGLAFWAGFMTGADRIALDTHPYFAFDNSPATDPIDTGTGAGAGGMWPQAACNRWASSMNTSRNAFGPTLAGEWSNGFNDCGLFLKGVGGTTTFGGNCDDWQDSSNWTDGTKAGLQAFGAASMDALRDWFFWTWKVAPSATGVVGSPLWSYQLGLRGGWILKDPRAAIGVCGAGSGPKFDGTFDSWMTGGAGAGTIAAAQTTQFPYPPTALQGTDVAELPVYTSTGAISTLPAPTFTGTSGQAVGTADGWFNANDNAPAPTPIVGCVYPDPWNALTAAIPTGCSGGPGAALPATITPPPSRRR